MNARLAIIVGMTALAMTPATRKEYCPRVTIPWVKPIECRDGAEGEPGRHHQGIVPALIDIFSEKSDHRVEPEYLADNLTGQKENKDQRCSHDGRK